MGALKDFFSNSANFTFETGKFYFKGLSNSGSSRFSVPDTVDDDDYRFTLYGLPQKFVDRNKKYDSDNLITVSELDTRDLWVLLSHENGFVRMTNDVSFSQQDYVFLNTPDMIKAGKRVLEESPRFASFRIEQHFIKLKEKKTITEVEIEFFTNYSSFVTNSAVKRDV